MNLVSFDALSVLDMPGVKTVKAEKFYESLELIKSADWVLFPPYYLVNTLYYALGKKIFPSINNYHLGHNKVEMTRAFNAICPENMPYTLILPNTPGSREQILDEMFFPFVAKEIRSARGCGVYLIENREQFENYADGEDILYVQMYLPINRDMRLVFIGDRVVSAYWREAPNGGFKNNVFQGGRVVYDPIPEAAVELVEKTARGLGVNFAGFDVADVEGNLFFFEFNNRFGNQGLHDQNISMGKLIGDYLKHSK